MRIKGGIQGPEGRNQREKVQAVWKNVGEDRERQSRVKEMAAVRRRAKEDTGGRRKMRVGGGGLGGKKEEDRK